MERQAGCTHPWVPHGPSVISGLQRLRIEVVVVEGKPDVGLEALGNDLARIQGVALLRPNNNGHVEVGNCIASEESGLVVVIEARYVRG
jgi:hypothetical protein